MSEAIFIPEPDAAGYYRYPDGSGFRFSERVGKWSAWWKRGSGTSKWWPNTASGCCALLDADDKQAWFATKEEAAQAIAEGGEGPARPETKGEPMSEQKHTPTPWYVGAQNDAVFIIDRPPRPSTDDVVPGGDVVVIAKLSADRLADARRIVAAVNAHAGLLAACEEAAEFLEADDRRTVRGLRGRILALVAAAKEQS